MGNAFEEIDRTLRPVESQHENRDGLFDLFFGLTIVLLATKAATYYYIKWHTFDQQIATFFVQDLKAVEDDFHATISWGDGEVSQGLIKADGAGKFNVLATHTYSQNGSYIAHVNVIGANGAQTSNTVVIRVEGMHAPSILSV